MTDLSKFKDIYFLETEEHLQKLNDNLLALEKAMASASPSAVQAKLLDELMRSSHTIKGSSASMGYNQMAFLTHVLEDVFDTARNGRLALNADIINRAFAAIDALENCESCIKKDDQEADLNPLALEIKAMTGVNTVGVGKSVRNDSAESGASHPASPESSAAEKDPEAEAPSGQHEIDAVAKIDYIKVPVERLDNLMDLVEELLIDKMRLEQLRLKHQDLEELADHISLLTTSIQYQVMQARLVPVEQVFARFPRMVRDLSQKMGKNIDLNIIGSEIELDRTIVDKLGEPLVHLLRNAIDHGISKKGNIVLRAVRESDYVLIMVENDDQGIDFEKVKKAAAARNIVSAKDIDSLDDAALKNLLFNPRLSTKEQVTEVSGRGVGLSVVKQFVESLGGQVIVENTDPGARFTLQLPLTIAIINALLVNIAGSIFALPFASIVRSVSVEAAEIKKMADHDMAVIDGMNIPLIRLDRIFNLRAANTGVPVPGQEEAALTVVLVKKENDMVGVVIDSLIGDHEITVKPLSPILRGVKGFSGSTILGGGQTVLILDVANLV